MTTATGEKLGQTSAHDDYGQALAEGEITRILKTVQAAQFKKSKTLAATEDTEFRPRSLVEIAFAAEQKRKQAEEATEQQLEQQTLEADEEDPASTSAGELDAAALGEQESSLHTNIEQGETVSPANDEAADKAAQAEQQAEEEAIRLAAEEEGYKRGFEAGLEAARTAEPTPEEIELLAEKEQQRQAIIQQFYDAIAALASPQALDSSALEAMVHQAVLELASERTGQVITENPEGLLMRIKSLIDKVKSAATRVEISLNPSDLAVLENWLRDRPAPVDWQFTANGQLANGDIRLILGGIEVADVAMPVTDRPDAGSKEEALNHSSAGLGTNLKDDQLETNSGSAVEEDELKTADEEHNENLSTTDAEAEPAQNTHLENAKVSNRPAFIPEPTEDVELDDDISQVEEAKKADVNERDKE